MATPLETGKTLVDQILAKLPDAVRATVAPAFAAPEAADALTLLGDSALARSDYSRAMDEIKKKEGELGSDFQRLTDWFTEHKAKLEDYDRIKPDYDKLRGNPNPNPNPNPPTPPATSLTMEAVEKHLQERDAQRDSGYAAVLGITTTLTARHMKDFNEVLDVPALIAHAQKNRIPLYDLKAETDAYRALHGEKLTAKAKAEYDARVEKDVQERLAAERRTQAQPYPLRGGQEPSVLDALQTPDREKRFTADSAAQRYEELVASAARTT